MGGCWTGMLSNHRSPSSSKQWTIKFEPLHPPFLMGCFAPLIGLLIFSAAPNGAMLMGDDMPCAVCRAFGRASIVSLQTWFFRTTWRDRKCLLIFFGESRNHLSEHLCDKQIRRVESSMFVPGTNSWAAIGAATTATSDVALGV